MLKTKLLLAAAPLALTASLTVFAPVHAAEAEAETTVSEIEITGQRDITLDHLQQTGSRLGLTALETPASVDTVPGDTIRERGDYSTQEAVSRITGFTSVGTPGDGGSAVSARGFTGLNSVMQLYDGTRLYVVAGTITFPFDPWTADRIEALRGPASVMFGEGAIGGAINVVPKHANRDMRVIDYQVGYGSFNTFRVGLGAGGPINDVLAYRVDGSYNSSDNWVERSDSHSTAISGELRWQATPNLALTLRDDYGDNHPMVYFGTPLINHRLDESILKTNYDVADSIIHYKDNWTQLKAEWTGSESFSAKNVLYYLTSDRVWQNAEGYFWNGTTNRIDRVFWFTGIEHDQHQFGDRIEGTFKGQIGGLKNSLSGGAEFNTVDLTYSHNGFTDIEDQGLGDVSVAIHNPVVGTFANLSYPILPAFKTKSNQYAFFAEDRLQLTDQFSLVGGVRYDNFKYERHALPNGAPFGKTFSYTDWRIGAVYQPSSTLSFYAQYATGSDPLGSLATTSSSTVNNGFDLSTAYQAEAGVKQIILGGRGQWSLALYDIDKKKLLASVPGHPNQFNQVGERSAKGIEGSFVVNPADGWTFEANAAFVDAKYESYEQGTDNFTGNTPPGVPETTANLMVAWRFLPKWEARGAVRYVGKSFSDDANTFVLPSYTVTDLGLDWKVRDNATITARVTNVFDEVYASTFYVDEQWIIGRPRAFEVSVRGRF